jgi:hypothetical protein
MLKQIGRKVAICVTLVALAAPAAFASSPTGTDPEPGGGVVQTILTLLGLG